MKQIFKILISVFSILILAPIMGATIPYEEWNKRFEIWDSNPILEARQISDGGYIVTQIHADFDNPGFYTGGFFKTDSRGNKQWGQGLANCGPASIWQTTDGGYIVPFSCDNYSTNDHYSTNLLKTDRYGNKMWNKTFRGVPASIQQTKDGGYILAGSINSNVWLFKTDSYGNAQWSKTFGGINPDNANSVQQTKDGGYILAGNTKSFGSGDFDAWLIKTDSYGNKQWSKTFGGINPDNANSVQQTKDGGFILAGSLGFDTWRTYAWLIKTDSYGNKQWSKTFGYIWKAGYVQQTLDGGYILAGCDNSGTGNCKGEEGAGWIIKTDINGNKLWNKTYSYPNSGGVGSAQQTKDGGYIIAGGSPFGWLIKLGAENLLKNPGFETLDGIEPMYWDKYQTGTRAIFTYPEIGRTGTDKSVAIKYVTRESGKVALWWQNDIPIESSKQYKLFGYMKLEGVTGGGSLPRYNGADIRINWYKSDGNVIKVDLITKSGTSAWTKYENTFTSPSNAVKATVGGDLFNSSGKVWFDDMSLVRVS